MVLLQFLQQRSQNCNPLDPNQEWNKPENVFYSKDLVSDLQSCNEQKEGCGAKSSVDVKHTTIESFLAKAVRVISKEINSAERCLFLGLAGPVGLLGVPGGS
ncbi:hypothetical protein NDU88_008404 [Pleurodeles waltl]|uniref:Uncharacterized protein n=1 Tax=Pleurodeles waltl TaxID=8319 RepID=A0AAV7RXK6_PLEWA|nr:hypothetical protein NDU88_008404 [Pleurodeles waltl]